jgi:hypothetical protein
VARRRERSVGAAQQQAEEKCAVFPGAEVRVMLRIAGKSLADPETGAELLQ